MTSLHWQTSLQNRQCHALCTLGRTSKCDKVFATYMSFTDLVYYRLGCDLFVFGAYSSIILSQLYWLFIYALKYFSHRPPLYDVFDIAELYVLHAPCSWSNTAESESLLLDPSDLTFFVKTQVSTHN